MSRRTVYEKLNRIPGGSAGTQLTRGCLVLEGGAFRGLYTQGLLDAWMRHGINFDCVIGVSAGALAGLNYTAGQIGRSARCNLGCRHDTNYIGREAVRKSRSAIRLDFLLEDYNAVEPLDEARFYDPARRFVAVSTNCLTARPVYAEKGKCPDILTAVKASASMPYITPAVELEGAPCLDGGCSDPIPYHWAMEQGYEKIIVVRTRDLAFRKKKDGRSNLPELFYKEYPQFAELLHHGHVRYNAMCDELDELSADGRIFAAAPSKPVRVSRIEGDVSKLGHLYWRSYGDGLAYIEPLKRYLEQ